MFDLLVNEGGLITAGYVVTISVGIVLFWRQYFRGKEIWRSKMTIKAASIVRTMAWPLLRLM